MSNQTKKLDRISKYLSLLLRHKPELGNLSLDSQGYTCVEGVLKALDIDKETLDLIVETDNKKRYSYKMINDKLYIRANQGHSVKAVCIDFKEFIPDSCLYHGTAKRFIDNIMKEGLKPQSRNMVHLSLDIETATSVGLRHSGTTKEEKLDNLVILNVDAVKMYSDGYKFKISDNGVVQIESVPTKYLSMIKN